MSRGSMKRWSVRTGLAVVVGCLMLLGGCFPANVAPVAIFSWIVNQLSVTFDATPSYDSDGTIRTYYWSFGDGSSANGEVVTHEYSTTSSRSYQVTLRITDDDGDTDSVANTVQVTPAPVPTPTPTPSPSPGVDYSVTVGEMYDEFDANEIAATLKYQNSTVAVSGYINNVSISVSGEPLVTLKRGPGFYFAAAFCYFPESAMAELASLAEDEFITVVGDFDKFFLSSIWLEDCRLP